MILKLAKGVSAVLGAATLMAGCATAPSSGPQMADRTSNGAGGYAVQQMPSRYSNAEIYHVTYAFSVGPMGRALDASLVDFESPPMLVLSSRQALMESTFTPCEAGGDCRRTYTFRFIVPKVIITGNNP